MKFFRSILFFLGLAFFKMAAGAAPDSIPRFCGHEVRLDDKQEILPWKNGAQNAYDNFLRLRWNFIKTKVPLSPAPAPRSLYPQYYFYCAFIDSSNVLLPDWWMNDVGEKIPNWFESALSFYLYTGDTIPLTITKGMVDYSLAHGITPANYSWPHFPQTGADAGATEFRGFTGRFSSDDVQVDHAGDMGITYYRMFLYYGDKRYKEAAVRIADVLVQKIDTGTASRSPWPYVVNMRTGKVVSEYGTNFFGCLRLLKTLSDDSVGDARKYKSVYDEVKEWILSYPLKNGLWVDGHSDNLITGTSNLSNLSASNAALFIADFKTFDPGWQNTLPDLIRWTEENFITKSAPGEPSNMWGANIVSEQVDFMPKMDYQTARYAAQCATWYALSGEEAYKEKAFRSLNWVTYCNDSVGKAFESPVSKDVHSWWSDCYGECPRMFYHVFAAIPEWAPEHENHILYSKNVLKEVNYSESEVTYVAAEAPGEDFLRLKFKPSHVSANGRVIELMVGGAGEGYRIKKLPGGEYAVTVMRNEKGKVVISFEKSNR